MYHLTECEILLFYFRQAPVSVVFASDSAKMPSHSKQRYLESGKPSLRVSYVNKMSKLFIFCGTRPISAQCLTHDSYRSGRGWIAKGIGSRDWGKIQLDYWIKQAWADKLRQISNNWSDVCIYIEIERNMWHIWSYQSIHYSGLAEFI